MLHLPRNKHGRSGSANQRAGSTPARGRRAGALLFLALSTSLAANLAEPHHVTAVRFWSLSGVTRIAVETDGDFELKSDRLDNPDRLFFDLIGTRPTLGRKSMTVIPVSDHLIKQIRVAEPQHNVTRVVLDLETSVEPTTSRLDNPTRLIIELRASGSVPETPKPETTKGPVRTPPALVQPPPGPKPVDRASLHSSTGSPAGRNSTPAAARSLTRVCLRICRRRPESPPGSWQTPGVP